MSYRMFQKKYMLIMLFILPLLFVFEASEIHADIIEGSREIPFWGDKVTDENYKPHTFDEDEIIQKVEEIGGGANFGIDGEGVAFISEKAEKFVKAMSGIIFGLAFIMVTFAGFKYAMSEGDERKMREAKMQILTAGIGIGLSVFTFVIIELVKSIISAVN